MKIFKYWEVIRTSFQNYNCLGTFLTEEDAIQAAGMWEDSSIKVYPKIMELYDSIEDYKTNLRGQALSKLTREEKETLGL